MEMLEKLLSIDLEKVEDQDIQQEVRDLLAAHAEATYKEDFAQARKDTIQALVEWVAEEFPQAFEEPAESVTPLELAEEPEEAETSWEEDSTEEPLAAPARSKKVPTVNPKPRPALPNPKSPVMPSADPDLARAKVLEELEMLEKEFERCEEAISLYRATRKAMEGPQNKPLKTRATKLRERLIGIAKLTPPNLQSKDAIQLQNRKILHRTFVDLMKNWGMDAQVEKGKKAFATALEQIEDTFEVKDRRELANRWKGDLPHERTVKRLEKKKDEALTQRTKAIHKIIKEAIGLFRKDDDTAWEHLDAYFSEGQLQAYLPNYILNYRKTQSAK